MYLQFVYTNHDGDTHTYVIKPTGADTLSPVGSDAEELPVLHGDVITRDGDPRLDMDPTRRRTFVIADMAAIENVPEETT